MYLKPGCAAEYVRRHDAIWPELKKLLGESGVSDYSIFRDPETDQLFAVQKISGEGGSQELGSEEIVRRWWASMKDIMETNPDDSPVSIPLEECFHME